MRSIFIIILSLLCIACQNHTPYDNQYESQIPNDTWQIRSSGLWMSERDQKFMELAQEASQYQDEPVIETTTFIN